MKTGLWSGVGCRGMWLGYGTCLWCEDRDIYFLGFVWWWGREKGRGRGGVESLDLVILCILWEGCDGGFEDKGIYGFERMLVVRFGRWMNGLLNWECSGM